MAPSGVIITLRGNALSTGTDGTLKSPTNALKLHTGLPVVGNVTVNAVGLYSVPQSVGLGVRRCRGPESCALTSAMAKAMPMSVALRSSAMTLLAILTIVPVAATANVGILC